VFLRNPIEASGFDFGQLATAGTYVTPVVSFVTTLASSTWFKYFQIFIIAEELAGRYLNDWIMNTSIKRNSSVFEAESRLWYCRLVLHSFGDWLTSNQDLLCHFASVHDCIKSDERCYPKSPQRRSPHHGVGVLPSSLMINTMVVPAYGTHCFPKHQV